MQESGSSGPFYNFPSEQGIPDASGLDDLLKSFLNDSETAGLDLEQGPLSSQAYQASVSQPGQQQLSHLGFQQTAQPPDSKWDAVGINLNTLNSLGAILYPEEGIADSGHPVTHSHSSSHGKKGGGASTVSKQAPADEAFKIRNRAAQKRFRERRKALQANHHRQVEDLEQRMTDLLQENKSLQCKNKLLEHTVLVNSTQNIELQRQKEEELLKLQQDAIMEESVRIYSVACDHPDLTLEAAMKLTLETFCKVFELLLDKLKFLLANSGRTAGTPAHQQLSFIVSGRRMEEARLGLFSSWPSAVIAWNREETQANKQPPSISFYATVLAQLHLTALQQQEWLAARRQLLQQLAEILPRRDKAALAVGLLLMQQPHQVTGLTQEEQHLRAVLEEERGAVLAFLFTAIDCTLTPVQEAILDTSCFPWSPCIWTLCNILASKQKKEPPDNLPAPVQAGLFHTLSSADFLREPMLARMGGLQIKRVKVSIPLPHNIVAAARARVPTIAEMAKMSTLEVMMGKHLQPQSEQKHTNPVG